MHHQQRYLTRLNRQLNEFESARRRRRLATDDPDYTTEVPLTPKEYEQLKERQRRGAGIAAAAVGGTVGVAGLTAAVIKRKAIGRGLKRMFTRSGKAGKGAVPAPSAPAHVPAVEVPVHAPEVVPPAPAPVPPAKVEPEIVAPTVVPPAKVEPEIVAPTAPDAPKPKKGGRRGNPELRRARGEFEQEVNRKRRANKKIASARKKAGLDPDEPVEPSNPVYGAIGEDQSLDDILNELKKPSKAKKGLTNYSSLIPTTDFAKLKPSPVSRDLIGKGFRSTRVGNYIDTATGGKMRRAKKAYRDAAADTAQHEVSTVGLPRQGNLRQKREFPLRRGRQSEGRAQHASKKGKPLAGETTPEGIYEVAIDPKDGRHDVRLYAPGEKMPTTRNTRKAREAKRDYLAEKERFLKTLPGAVAGTAAAGTAGTLGIMSAVNLAKEKRAERAERGNGRERRAKQAKQFDQGDHSRLVRLEQTLDAFLFDAANPLERSEEEQRRRRYRNLFLGGATLAAGSYGASRWLGRQAASIPVGTAGIGASGIGLGGLINGGRDRDRERRFESGLSTTDFDRDPEEEYITPEQRSRNNKMILGAAGLAAAAWMGPKMYSRWKAGKPAKPAPAAAKPRVSHAEAKRIVAENAAMMDRHAGRRMSQADIVLPAPAPAKKKRVSRKKVAADPGTATLSANMRRLIELTSGFDCDPDHEDDDPFPKRRLKRMQKGDLRHLNRRHLNLRHFPADALEG